MIFNLLFSRLEYITFKTQFIDTRNYLLALLFEGKTRTNRRGDMAGCPFANAKKKPRNRVRYYYKFLRFCFFFCRTIHISIAVLLVCEFEVICRAFICIYLQIRILQYKRYYLCALRTMQRTWSNKNLNFLCAILQWNFPRACQGARSH